MANPLVVRARKYIEAGDVWARVALACADRARACWAEADASIGEAEAGFRALVQRIGTKRAEENADADVWTEIARQLDEERAA